MQPNNSRLNLLELLLTSMKAGSKYPFELTYLAGTLALILNPSAKRSIFYNESELGPTVIADLKDLYNNISQGKPWRGINPVIAISNPSNEGITQIINETSRQDLIKTYPLIGSTLGSVNDPFGSKDELIIIGNYDLDPLMKKLRSSLNSKLKIIYDVPCGFISRALYELSELAVSGIGKFCEQYGKYYFVARSVSQGFRVDTNFYYSQDAVPNEIVKREFTFQCISTDMKFGGAPFEVKAQMIAGEEIPKIININTNKVIGFSKRTQVMERLFSTCESDFVRNFSDAVKEAQTTGFAVMFSDGEQLNFAEVDGDVIVEHPAKNEITKVSQNPNDENDLQVEAVQTCSETEVPADQIKENLDGSNMNPEAKVDINEGIENAEKAGANERKTFSEFNTEGGSYAPKDIKSDPSVDTKGGASAPVDLKEDEVQLKEIVKDKQYSISSKQFSTVVNSDFRNAFALAGRLGNVSVLFSETEVPADQIKENLDGSNMNPEAKVDIKEGIVDAEKAGANEQKNFSEEDQKTLEEIKDKANELSSKVDELKETKDKNLANEVKNLSEELLNKAEGVTNHDVEDVKEMCSQYSKLCSDILDGKQDDTVESPKDPEASEGDQKPAENKEGEGAEKAEGEEGDKGEGDNEDGDKTFSSNLDYLLVSGSKEEGKFFSESDNNIEPKLDPSTQESKTFSETINTEDSFEKSLTCKF